MALFNWPLQKNTVGLEERLALIKFVATSNRFTNGPKCQEFEQAWNEWQGSFYSVYVANGSVANFLLLDAVKEKYFPTKDRLTIFAPAINWATNISTFCQQNHNVYFYDINYETYGPTTKSVNDLSSQGLVPDIIYLTHILGISNDINQIKTLWPNTIILEDCCESHGARDQKTNVKVGNTGIGSTFSFYFGHHMTTIEGGMVCVKDRDLYNLLRAKRSHGLSRETTPDYQDPIKAAYPDIDPTFLFPTKGYNFRNVETGAVLGLTQLKKLDKWNDQRNKNYCVFYEEMIDKPWFNTLPIPAGNSAMTLPFHCKNAKVAQNLKLLLQSMGIETRPFLVGNLLRQPFMQNYESLIGLPNSEKMHTHSFYIGNNHFVKPSDIKKLSKEIDECVF
jgi:CDP-6-deoxy-D-xylo-4-hexulose-3-dehydrase